MPQMKPLSWSLMLISSITILLFITMFIYFFYTPFLPSPSFNLNNQNFKWIWKW